MARKPKKISDFDVKLGAAIKRRRVDPEVDMSQAAAARAAGVPLSNYQRREDGTNEVTVSELERIAEVLGTTAREIVSDALSRYGGVDKLLAEHVTRQPVNVAPEDNVTYMGHVRPPERAAAKKKDEDE